MPQVSASAPVFTGAEPKAPTRQAPVHVFDLQPPPPATQRPEGAPARKGWWQKMIELD
jgi:hypothetical protein